MGATRSAARDPRAAGAVLHEEAGRKASAVSCCRRSTRRPTGKQSGFPRLDEWQSAATRPRLPEPAVYLSQVTTARERRAHRPTKPGPFVPDASPALSSASGGNAAPCAVRSTCPNCPSARGSPRLAMGPLLAIRRRPQVALLLVGPELNREVGSDREANMSCKAVHVGAREPRGSTPPLPGAGALHSASGAMTAAR